MAKPIKIEILGDATGFQKAVDGVGGALGKLGGLAGTTGLALGALAVGGVAAATKGLFDLGARFDDISDQLRVTTGATGDALEGLSESFRNVAANSYSSMEDVGTAIAKLNQRLEITGPELEDLSFQFLNLSRVTDTDLTTNIDNITRVFGDWSVSTKNQAGVLDELYRASQASGISLDELSTTLVQFGAPLRTVGFSLQESQALLALWNKTGVNTELVMSGLKIAAGKFGAEGKNAATEIQKVIDKIASMGATGDALSLAIETFGKKAGQDLVDAISGGKFAIDDMLLSITGGSDTINQAADDTADWAEKWQMIKNRVFLALEPVASRVFSAIGDGLDKWVAPAFSRGQEAIQAFKDAWDRADGTVTQSGLNGVMERLANIIQQSLWPWLQDLGTSIQIMATIAWPAFEAAGRGVERMLGGLIKFARDNDTVMLGLKVTLLGVAVALGAVALAVLAVSGVFAALVGVVVIAIAGVVGAITRFFQWIIDNRQKWIDNIKAPFAESFAWVERKWNDLKQTFTNPFGALTGGPTSVLSGMIPGRAYGGTVATAGMYQVNERGRENIFLPSGSRVQPNYAGARNGGGDVFNIYAPNATPAEVAREIAWRRRMGDGR